MAKLFDVGGGVLGALAGIGLALKQMREDQNKDTLAKATLMQGQGSWEPGSPEAMAAMPWLSRLLGIAPEGGATIGGQSYQFTPYPKLTEEDVRAMGLTTPVTRQIAGPSPFAAIQAGWPLGGPEVLDPGLATFSGAGLTPQQFEAGFQPTSRAVTTEEPIKAFVGMRQGPKERLSFAQEALKTRKTEALERQKLRQSEQADVAKLRSETLSYLGSHGVPIPKEFRMALAQAHTWDAYNAALELMPPEATYTVKDQTGRDITVNAKEYLAFQGEERRAAHDAALERRMIHLTAQGQARLDQPPPRAPSELAKLIQERDALPEDSPYRPAYDDRIQKVSQTASIGSVPGDTVADLFPGRFEHLRGKDVPKTLISGLFKTQSSPDTAAAFQEGLDYLSGAKAPPAGMSKDGMADAAFKRAKLDPQARQALNPNVGVAPAVAKTEALAGPQAEAARVRTEATEAARAPARELRLAVDLAREDRLGKIFNRGPVTAAERLAREQEGLSITAPITDPAAAERLQTRINTNEGQVALSRMTATEDIKVRIAQAGREEQPISPEAMTKLSALLTIRESIDTMREIMSRKGSDPAFLKPLKAYTGPWTGFVTQFLSQPFTSGTPDENRFVTALRNLQREEIRANAGLAQTGSEVAGSIGFIGGRLPTIFNPTDVFMARMQGTDDIVNRNLKLHSVNLQGRAIGRYLADYLKSTSGSTTTLIPSERRGLLRKRLDREE